MAGERRPAGGRMFTDAARARPGGSRTADERTDPIPTATLADGSGSDSTGSPTNRAGAKSRGGKRSATPAPPRFRFSLTMLLLVVVCLAGVMTAGSLLARAMRQTWAAQAAGQADPGNGQTLFFFLIAATAAPTIVLLVVSAVATLTRRGRGPGKRRRRKKEPTPTDPFADLIASRNAATNDPPVDRSDDPPT